MAAHLHMAFVTFAVAALVGCSSSPNQQSASDPERPAPTPGSAKAHSIAASSVQETESQKLGRLLKGVEGRSVYFDYDNFTIGDQFRPVLAAHADVLMKSGRSMVTVEGNADERGSREYNLALGQKRAAAAANLLKTLGVPADRLEAISFGKEKPRLLCHEEKCWAENRRVDFSYKLK